MTNRDYIMANLAPFGIREEVIAFVYGDVDPDGEYVVGDAKVGKALVKAIEVVMFMPRTRSVSESGFSITYDYADLSKFYLAMCRSYGVEPNDEILSSSGINMVVDRTDIW